MVKADELNIQMNQVEGARLGWISGSYVVDVVFAQRWLQLEKRISFQHDLPSDMQTLLDRGPAEMELLQEVERFIRKEYLPVLQVEGEPVAIQREEVQLLAPIPIPRSFRDFYAFEQHVKTSRQRRGLQMIPEWYQIPVFYFSNHRSII
jgi:fumarylacetoacetate (FAA) hydrolase